MIPILYDSTAKKKIDWLPDCLNCEVTEERNGMYELVIDYPVSGRSAKELINSRYIKSRANQTDEPQFFEIYKVSKPLSGIFTVRAHHISYELIGYPFHHATITGNAQIAINEVISAGERDTGLSSGFVAGSTDIETSGAIDLYNISARAALGGVEGSILDVFGGEYHFDNYKISLLKSRGKNNGVRISYAKNLTGLKVDIDSSGAYTGVYGFVKTDKADLHSLAKVENKSKVQERFKPVDFGSKFGEEEPTQERLDAITQAYAKNNDVNALKISMSVNFVDLSKSPEYRDFLPLEKVDLCDYVKIYCKMLDVSITAKVVKTVYNALSEEYTNIVVGNFQSNMGSVFGKATDAANRAEKKADEAKKQSSQIIIDTQEEIDRVTQAITGNSGGYIKLVPALNPQELLIMDTENVETSKNIWRFNLSGLGHSSTGYDGKYKTAITQDGHVVADFITVGSLTANVIKAGILRSADPDHLFSFNLESGEIIAKNAKLTGEFVAKSTTNELSSFVVSGAKVGENGEGLQAWAGGRFYSDRAGKAPYGELYGEYFPAEGESFGFAMTGLSTSYGKNTAGISPTVYSDGRSVVLVDGELSAAGGLKIRDCKAMDMAPDGGIFYKGVTIMGIYQNLQIGSPDQIYNTNIYTHPEGFTQFFVGRSLKGYFGKDGFVKV